MTLDAHALRRARWGILAAAALFSAGGAAIKACDLTPWQVACFRSAVGAATILLLAPESRRGWTRRTCLVACAYAATVLLFVLSNRMTTSANAIYLQSTAPLYVLLLGPFLLREPVRRRDLGFMAALAVGMGLFFAGTEAPRATAPDPVLGNVLAACSGLTWAATLVGLRWIARGAGPSERPAAAAAVAGNLVAFLVALPFALPVEAASAGDIALVAFLGVFQIGLAYVILTRSVRSVPALEVVLLLLLEPVLNPVWSWLVHGETPGPFSIAGALVILAATGVHAWRSGAAVEAPAAAPARVSPP